MSGVLHLRPATADDARRVWLWRNEPAARAASRNTDEVAWESHAAWFPTALARTRILIAEVAGKPVGMARLDPGSEWETVSLNVAPDRRGVGLGKAILQAVCAEAAGPLRAEIREENAASLRVFESCGFRRAGREGAFVQLQRP